MARPRQPINLLEAKGKKHLTKAEIEERRSTEVTASDDNIVAPEYLTVKQKREFDKIAKQLVDIKIMANLDCDALARFIIAKDQYVKFTKIVRKIPDDWKLINSLEGNADTGPRIQTVPGRRIRPWAYHHKPLQADNPEERRKAGKQVGQIQG